MTVPRTGPVGGESACQLARFINSPALHSAPLRGVREVVGTEVSCLLVVSEKYVRSGLVLSLMFGLLSRAKYSPVYREQSLTSHLLHESQARLGGWPASLTRYFSLFYYKEAVCGEARDMTVGDLRNV